MSLISPNFDAKSIFFPNFGQGPFPKIAGKIPESKPRAFAFLVLENANFATVNSALLNP